MNTNKTHKVGAITAAILFIATGLALLGEFMGLPAILWLINTWPVLFIILGIEYFFARPTEGGKSPPLAIGKIVTSLIISVIAIAAVQGWFFVTDTFMGSNNSTPHTQQIEPSNQTDRISLENRNGNARFESHAGDEVIVQADIRGNWFNFNSESAAKQVDISVQEQGDEIVINVGSKKPSFGFLFIQSHPTVHLTILLPEQRDWDLKVDQRNGNVSVLDVNIKDEARIQTTNGKIIASDLAGSLHFQSTNGNIEAHDVSGILDTRTTNGRIEISGATEQVRAKTTNGKLSVESSTVEGDWDLSTTNGSISLKLPEDGDFTFHGKTTNGSVSAPNPLEIDGKRIRGTIGSGDYEIDASTTNGSFHVEWHG